MSIVVRRLEALENAQGSSGLYHIVRDEDVALLDRGALNPQSTVSVVTHEDSVHLTEAVRIKLKSIAGRRDYERAIINIHFELPRPQYEDNTDSSKEDR